MDRFSGFMLQSLGGFEAFDQGHVSNKYKCTQGNNTY